MSPYELAVGLRYTRARKGSGRNTFISFIALISMAGIALGVAAFLTSWWRRPAVLWMVSTIVAYVIWISEGWETPDQIGIVCKLIELVALGLVLRLGPPGRDAPGHAAA